MVNYVKKLVKDARQSSYKLAKLSAKAKNKALAKMAGYLLKEKDYILRQNDKDVELAKKNKTKSSFIDRLCLNQERINEMSTSLQEIARLPDCINRVITSWQRPNGLLIQKVRVPIGVVLIIYEARPNVTSDCAGLLFKTSNAGILRGGKDALHSNKAIYNVLLKAVSESGIDFIPFFLVDKTAHRAVDLLLKENDYIDMVIPRGGEALVRKVVELSRIPVIKHYKGVCHIFIDKNINFKTALDICVNAKVQRPSVCNAVETILIHEKTAPKFLPLLKSEFDKYKVQMLGDTKTRKILKRVKKAQEKDWSEEYLDLIVSIKVVKDVDEAINHINRYGSKHTDAIITKNIANISKFTREVDSACCFSNISTRFSDGYQFGLGAEIGISTDKLHARGPMGAEELTTYKYVVYGNGQIRT
ncbi:MAG: glutamate-5-semialdehyde dehydrogenase [Candidatus Omnitrophota bacterium]